MTQRKTAEHKANARTIQALRASCIASKVSNEIAAIAFPASETQKMITTFRSKNEEIARKKIESSKKVSDVGK